MREVAPMKNWLAATLFPRVGAFPWRVGLALGVITLTTAGVAGATRLLRRPAAAEGHRVSSARQSPVTASRSGNGTGGAAFAGSPLKFEVATTAAAPNSPAGNFRDLRATAAANLTDVIVSGARADRPGASARPFHANIYQVLRRDVRSGAAAGVAPPPQPTVWSSSSANLQFNATLRP